MAKAWEECRSPAKVIGSGKPLLSVLLERQSAWDVAVRLACAQEDRKKGGAL